MEIEKEVKKLLSKQNDEDRERIKKQKESVNNFLKFMFPDETGTKAGLEEKWDWYIQHACDLLLNDKEAHGKLQNEF